MEKSERQHSTVRLNQFTLKFEDPVLEQTYQAGLHPRKKALWLRSLLPAAASQLLFVLADGLDFPIENLLLTVPTRVFLAMLQVATWLLVRWDLVQVREQTMLMVSVASGIPTLLLYTLQRTSLCHWDALFVTFGLSFYTIPKVTPLSYVSSSYGSWATTALYTVLTFVIRPSPRQVESVLGIFYLVPMVWVFNTIAYYSECNSRERFALRRRLHRESITLAVACTTAGGEAVLQDGEEDGWLFHKLSLRGIVAANTNSTASFVVAVILWGAFTLGSWTSLPDTLKFVDEATGWAWFSHCAGVTVFLLVMTRRLRWLLVVPVVGALLLWVMSLAMPASWIIFSAHSMGYGLLLASVVVAMGVFGWFVCAWRELVSFLTRSCFLYPQLQAGMEREYPLLVRIVSEHKAGFDPEILSARVPTTIAINSMGTHTSKTTVIVSQNMGQKQPTLHPPTVKQQKGKGKSIQLQTASEKQNPSTASKCLESVSALKKTITSASSPSERENTVVVTDKCLSRKMISILPSSKPGKCFFCSKNDAEHFVPACGMWGKWTYWRMNQQHNTSTLSKRAIISKGTTAVSMCTSYYDLQNAKSQLEARVQDEEKKNADLMKKLAVCEGYEQKLSLENVSLKAALCAMEQKHAADLRRCEAHFKEQMEVVQKEANRLAHERKLQTKSSAAAHAATLQNRLAVSELLIQEANTCVQNANEEAAALHLNLKQKEADIAEWKTNAEELKKQLSSMELRLQHQSQGRTSLRVGSSALDCLLASSASRGSSVDGSPLTSLQPVGRLPYAQSLEIEGLRESSRHSHEEVDYSKRWRLLQVSDLNRSGTQSVTGNLNQHGLLKMNETQQ